MSGIFASLFRADLTVLVRTGRTMLLNILVPIMILVITGLQSGKTASSTTFSTGTFDIGLALTYGLLSSSLIGYSITVARDRDAGVFQRLRVTPAPTWAIMTSRLLVQLVLDLIMTVIVVIVGAIMHHLTLTVGEVLLFGCISLLGGIVFLAIGQAVVGLVRSVTAVNAIGRALYVILLLLGLLGSTGVLGDSAKTLADWSPVGAVIVLYSGVLTQVGWGLEQTDALIACAGYILVGAFIGIRWFRWEAR
jgi:ABC-2 type transport system permease protein